MKTLQKNVIVPVKTKNKNAKMKSFKRVELTTQAAGNQTLEDVKEKARVLRAFAETRKKEVIIAKRNSDIAKAASESAKAALVFAKAARAAKAAKEAKASGAELTNSFNESKETAPHTPIHEVRSSEKQYRKETKDNIFKTTLQNKMDEMSIERIKSLDTWRNNNVKYTQLFKVTSLKIQQYKNPKSLPLFKQGCHDPALTFRTELLTTADCLYETFFNIYLNTKKKNSNKSNYDIFYPVYKRFRIKIQNKMNIINANAPDGIVADVLIIDLVEKIIKCREDDLLTHDKKIKIRQFQNDKILESERLINSHRYVISFFEYIRFNLLQYVSTHIANEEVTLNAGSKIRIRKRKILSVASPNKPRKK
jgi:hypothetical protein